MMRILIIEDNPDHLTIIEDSCNEAFPENCSIESFGVLCDGLAAIKTKPFDIALVDLSLPDSAINETMLALSSLATSVPIIVLTSLDDEELGRQIVSQGAQDFLPKADLSATLLNRMVQYAIERKRKHVELEDKSVNQETFCQSLSHDFKSPIRNIDQLTGLLKKQLSDREVLIARDTELFDLIESRLSFIQVLVDGLRDYIRSDNQTNSPKEVDLNHIVSELSEIINSASEKKAVITSDDLPIIQGEYSQLFLMMQNILENAIKYCNVAPHINILAKKINYRHASGQTLHHEVSIQDNGIGIDEPFLETIFEPFKRLHSDSEYMGSGLGLSVVKRIVANHNGIISVTSSVGEGTCITLQFP